eukprot:12772404-Alexandrium_andersonii.AAC.1
MMYWHVSAELLTRASSAGPTCAAPPSPALRELANLAGEARHVPPERATAGARAAQRTTRHLWSEGGLAPST